MLRLEDIKFRHHQEDTPYVFSLEASTGDTVGIMGPSGSGKSTLLDLIAGFQIPESGSMHWDNLNLIPLPPEQRPVTILFQHNNLFGHLTAARNVAIGINPSRRISTEEQSRVLNVLRQVGLAGHEDQRASTLSGGQQQRVALARAILRDRPILLLDEPFGGLDDETRHDMLDLVRVQAAENNKCVLMVTHDESDCEAIATKRYVVDAGKLASVAMQ